MQKIAKISWYWGDSVFPFVLQGNEITGTLFSHTAIKSYKFLDSYK